MVLPLNKIALAIQGAKSIKEMLPDTVFVEMKKYVDTTVQSAIEKMNLVTQDKFEEQNCKSSKDMEQSDLQIKRDI